MQGNCELSMQKYLRAWLKKSPNGTVVRVINNVHIHISFHVLSTFDFIDLHDMPLSSFMDSL